MPQLNRSRQITETIDPALMFDPFEGDVGGKETRIINEITDAPAAPRCQVCHGPIKPGTKVRRIVETGIDLDDIPEDADAALTVTDVARYERERVEYLICQTCCNAARQDDEDGGDRTARRGEAGDRRRSKEAKKHSGQVAR